MIQSVFGLFVMLMSVYLLSEDKKAIKFKTIGIALVIHMTLAVIFLKLPVFRDIFSSLNSVVLALQEATTAGTRFVFGYLAGDNFPFEITDHSATFILGFKALPLILFISVLSSLLYYYRVLPLIVQFLSLLLHKSLNISGAVSIGVAANAFVGMVEAPLFIKPYLRSRTRGELFSIMTAGMATIAGTVMVLYANILSSQIPDAMGHILTASLLNIFASLIITMMLIPHNINTQTTKIELPQLAHSPMDAIVRGTTDGIKLLVNIGAMLIVFVALVNLINQCLAFLPEVYGQPVTLQAILGILMAPVMFLIGIPMNEVFTAGSLMGTKVVLNELLAYLNLLNLPEDALQNRSRVIMLYAMCGFANMGSLGIMVGGMTAMAPEKREDIISLGMKSVLAGVLATCLTATVVGMVIS